MKRLPKRITAIVNDVLKTSKSEEDTKVIKVVTMISEGPPAYKELECEIYLTHEQAFQLCCDLFCMLPVKDYFERDELLQLARDVIHMNKGKIAHSPLRERLLNTPSK